MAKRILQLAWSEKWDEGYPLGNARLGGIFYGEKEAILSLDKSDLWDLTPAPESLEEGFNYPHYVGLIQKGDPSSFAESCRLFDACYARKTPTKLKAGRLHLSFDLAGASSSLNLANGLLKVEGRKNAFDLFFSQTRGCFAFRFAQQCPLRFEAQRILFPLPDGLGYPAPKTRMEEALEIDEVDSKEGFFFAFLLLRKGRFAYGDIVSYREGGQGLEERISSLLKCGQDGFDLLLREQEAWWDLFYQESSVALPEEPYQREYDLNEYFLGSCSKKGFPPMPLQGVWCADNDALPPWKGDYHHDVNTEGCYASALKGNHLNAFESWTDWLVDQRPVFEENARSFYHLPGLVLPGVSDSLGRPLGGWPMYALSPFMGVWAFKSLMDEAEKSYDERFLREKAYPILEEAGEAIAALLKKGKNGKLCPPLSSSPEIHDNTLASYLAPFSNCDLALTKWLFFTLEKQGKRLGKDVSSYRNILSDLPEYSLDKDGSLMLSEKENISESHRHFSHLLALYPLDEFSPDNPKDRLTMLASLRRLEYLGSALWVGFSFPYEALIAERAGEKELAKKRLDQFLDGFLSVNGFHLNGDYRKKGYSEFDYRPFTLEGNFLFQSAILEMLLQEREGRIVLFPDVPNAWKEVSFQQLRSEKGLLVSASYRDGQVTFLSIFAPKPETVEVVFQESHQATALSVSLCSGPNRIR